MITIYNKKIIFTNHKNKRSKVSESSLLQHVDDAVTLDENVTFERIMNLLALNSGHVNFFFNRALGGHHIQDYFNDMNEAPTEDCNIDVKNEFLEVYQFPDIWKYKKTDKRLTYSLINGFHLINIKEKIPYGLSFQKLSNLKKLKIKINLEMDFYIHDASKKFNKKTYNIPALQVVQESMRLYDFFQAILDEISFFGEPSNRDKVGKRLSEVEYDFSNEKGKTNLTGLV